MNKQEKAIGKIKRCLALSASSNEHEATAALRQAKKLMKKHGLSMTDVDAASVKNHGSAASSSSRPTDSVQFLSQVVAAAFNCFSLNQRYINNNLNLKWSIRFIGVESDAELCAYCFDVLRRQLECDLKHYRHGHLSRCGFKTRQHRMRLFGLHWVDKASEKLKLFQPDEQKRELVIQHISHKYPDLQKRESKPIESKGSGDLSAAFYGSRKGSEAKLNRGVTGAERKALVAA